MPRIVFTPQLRRFVDAPECEVQALSLREALQQAFEQHTRLRDYVLDEQQHLRTHVVVFIDGQRSRDRQGLSDALQPDSVVHVLQALSGG